MPDYTDILAEAPSWEGTPYHHHAALKGIGADCVGLLAGVAHACHRLPAGWMMPAYSTQWHWHTTRSLLVETLEELGAPQRELATAVPGCILLFRIERAVGHAGILLPDGIFLHARMIAGMPQHGTIRRARLRGRWQCKCESAYDWPEVQ
jgi:cell wall-associated NlpC family hydrolase